MHDTAVICMILTLLCCWQL